MFIATIVATAIGLIYLTKLRKYEFNLALLSCIPGGQAEMILISRELTEKDYVVALFHLVRVTLVFCFVPIMLAFVQGSSKILKYKPSYYALHPRFGHQNSILFCDHFDHELANCKICSFTNATLTWPSGS